MGAPWTPRRRISLSRTVVFWKILRGDLQPQSTTVSAIPGCAGPMRVWDRLPAALNYFVVVRSGSSPGLQRQSGAADPPE